MMAAKETSEMLLYLVVFGAFSLAVVWSLFGVLSWVEDRLEERSHRLSPDWVERRKWGRP